MKKINYEIIFHSDWHCGSGLAAGADVDALVIKDKDGLPFVPGKTIKGLLREAIDLITISQKSALIDLAFGIKNDDDRGIIGGLYFSNAIMQEYERISIVANKVTDFLYRSVSSTAIDDFGIAKDHSLRKVQVTIPCVLVGEILIMSDDLAIQEEELISLIDKAFGYIKRLGVGRNRGLGRCTIKRIKEGGNK